MSNNGKPCLSRSKAIDAEDGVEVAGINDQGQNYDDNEDEDELGIASNNAAASADEEVLGGGGVGTARDQDSPTSRQSRENNLAAVLIGISLLFIFCQSAKIIPDLYEVIYCRWGGGHQEQEDDEGGQDQGGEEGEQEKAEKGCEISPFIEKMVHISHFLLAINSSANFIIYSWRGK